MAKDEITLALNGDVTLGDFSTAVAEFLNLVKGLESDMSPGKPIDWFIVGLEAGSAIATIQGCPVEGTEPADVERVVDAYMDVGRSIQQGKQLSYSNDTKKAARNLLKVIDGRITSLRFENIESDVEVFRTPEIFTQVQQPVKLEISLGAVRGRVQSMTNRGSLRFTVYDLIDDRAISCYLTPGNEEMMRESWGRVAMVEGMVHRDPETGRATTVRNVQEIRIIHEGKPGEWREALGAAKGFLGDDLPEDVIRRARDG